MNVLKEFGNERVELNQALSQNVRIKYRAMKDKREGGVPLTQIASQG
jgi:hypothetical protein